MSRQSGVYPVSSGMLLPSHASPCLHVDPCFSSPSSSWPDYLLDVMALPLFNLTLSVTTFINLKIPLNVLLLCQEIVASYYLEKKI